MRKSIVALVLIFTCFGYSQVKIKGVITYYFNEYQGNKPDIGSTLVIVDTSKVKNFDFDLWNNYYYGKGYRKIQEQNTKIYNNYSLLYENTKSDKDKKENDRFKKEKDDAFNELNKNFERLKKYNSETDEKFNDLDKILFPTLFQFISGKDQFIEVTIDVTGSYNINITPGVYYVFIKSKNRTGLTITDVSGTTYITKVKVSNNDKDVSHNFELD